MVRNENKFKCIIMTFGLTQEQNSIIESTLPTKDYRIIEADAASDFLALSYSAGIINVSALSTDGRELILDFYREVGDYSDETIFWIDKDSVPRPLPKPFKSFSDFDDLKVNLKYLLLSAHNRSKKGREFSRKLSDCMKIMKLIKDSPYISTRKISELLEVSTRTVQRYIEALRLAGEFIDYDASKKGWYLGDGLSMFMENDFD